MKPSTFGKLSTALVVLVLTTASVVGCSSGGAGVEPSPPAAASAETETTPTPAPTETPSATETPLPVSCEQVYSPEMLTVLQGKHPPLNDASMGAGMFSDLVDVDALIRASTPLVCTWGVAGPIGIVTAVTRMTEEQTNAAHTALMAAGFECAASAEAVMCGMERVGERSFTVAEEHYFRAGIGLSTRWVNAGVDGYTDAMIAAIWG